MKRKCLIAGIMCVMLIGGSLSSFAQEMRMYVNNQFVIRDVESVAGFDMLPVLDIAGELGFNFPMLDGAGLSAFLISEENRLRVLNNEPIPEDENGYGFTINDPVVYDEHGRTYGLDVVPQFINGKFMVPAKFFQDVMGKSYIWDSVTNTIFLGSDDTYNWLINTEEYKVAKNKSKQLSIDEAKLLVMNFYSECGAVLCTSEDGYLLLYDGLCSL